MRKALIDEALDLWASPMPVSEVARRLNRVHGTKYSAKHINRLVSLARKSGDPRAALRPPPGLKPTPRKPPYNEFERRVAHHKPKGSIFARPQLRKGSQ